MFETFKVLDDSPKRIIFSCIFWFIFERFGNEDKDFGISIIDLYISFLLVDGFIDFNTVKSYRVL